MKRLIIAFVVLPAMALAQPEPPQFCVSSAVAQTLASVLQQDAAMLALLNDTAQEPQRQAAAVAAAVAKQKADADAAGKAGGSAAPLVAKP